MTARDEGNAHALVNLLRSGLVRNLGNITAPKLYNRSFAGTKFLIEEYITQVAEAIDDIGSLPSGDRSGAGNNNNGGGGDDGPARANGGWEGLSTQVKLDFVHDTRQAFGRSTLVLQGGAIFGLCHLGVVKALFLRGLLPRIITGTATGALIAALVSIHNEEELPAVLKGDGIDLSAFSGKGGNATNDDNDSGRQSFWTRWHTLVRRARRFWREGYFLDVKVLEDCVRTNVGDLTFEEAYNRSKRVLNITVATAGQDGVPTLLNYLTAPNVVCVEDNPVSLSRCSCHKTPLLRRFSAHMDRRGCIQRLVGVIIWTPRNHRPLQGCAWEDRPVETRQYGLFPALDTRVLFGPGIPAAAHS